MNLPEIGEKNFRGELFLLAIFLAYVASIPFEASKLLFSSNPEWLPSTEATGYHRVSIWDLSRVLLIPMTLGILYSWIKERRIRFALNGVNISFFLLLFLFSLSGIFVGLTGDYLLELMRISSNLIPFYAASVLIQSRSRLRLFFSVIIVSSLVVAAFGIIQYGTGYYLWFDALGSGSVRRVNSFVYDPNHLARYMVISLVILFVGTLDRKHWQRSSYIAAIGSGIVLSLCLFLTFSRNGLVTAIAIFGLLALIWVSSIGKKVVPVLNALFLTALLGIAGLFVSGVLDDWIQRFDPRVFLFSRGTIRGELLRIGWAMFLDNPIFGVGVTRFSEELYANYLHLLSTDYIQSDRLYVSLPQTSIIAVLAQFGLSGFLWLSGFMYAIYNAIKKTTIIDRSGRWLYDGLFLVVLVIFVTSQGEGRFFEELYLWVVAGAVSGVYTGTMQTSHRG